MRSAEFLYSGGVIRATIATRFWEKARGLVFERNPSPLLLPGVRAVHGFGILTPLHIWFLDHELVVLKIVVLKPGGIAVCRSARHALELPLHHFPVPMPGERLILSGDPVL